MPLFTYNRDIPDGPNNPSVDQPKMKINTNSIDDLIDTDHYSFDEANGGLHRQVRLVNEPIPSVSPGQVGIYSKVSGQSQQFITSDAGANEYQITRMRDANFATFGTLTVAGTVTAGYGIIAGWSFLPGGMYFQYGRVRRGAGISPSTIVVTYPISFTTSNIVVTVSPICRPAGSSLNNTASVVDGTVSTTGFTVNFATSTSEYLGFTWTAIGV